MPVAPSSGTSPIATTVTTDDADAVARHFIRCLDNSRLNTHPYNHWLLGDAFPEPICQQVVDLPFAPQQAIDTKGKRETNNASRTYFGAENRRQFPVCQHLAQALQSRAVTDRIQALCNTDLTDSFLRIEYCQDTEGFWLEPHTDIGVKRFTMLIYLSRDPGSENWGTDVLDADHNLVHCAPYQYNGGLIFIPADNTWHGFHKRPIQGIRRSLIVNYVGAEWRARHELAFPDQPVA